MNWSQYYVSRVNSKSYEDYFATKYSYLIDDVVNYVKQDSSILIIEDGCGIGSVTKQLEKYLPYNKYLLFDNDPKMLKLSKKNLEAYKNTYFMKRNILSSPKICYLGKKIVITHGVLEHFSDEHISQIVNGYLRSNIDQFHYVPTDGYTSPSFGDERLMSLTQWQNIARFKTYELVNHQDLYFRITR